MWPGLVWGQGVRLLMRDPGRLSLKCDPNKLSRVQRSRISVALAGQTAEQGARSWSSPARPPSTMHP